MSGSDRGGATTGRGGLRSWSIGHLAPVGRFYAGRRPSGVAVVDDVLPHPLESVRLRTYSPARGAADTRAVILYYPSAADVAALRGRVGEWLCGSLAKQLPAVVVRVDVSPEVTGQSEAGYEAVRWAAARHPHAQLAVLGAGDGGSLAARVSMLARDERSRAELPDDATDPFRTHTPSTDTISTDASRTDTPSTDASRTDTPSTRGPVSPHLERQALITPDFSLIAGPPATADALAASLVARLSELPPTLLQRPLASSAQLGGENLAVLLREAGVAVREIEYPKTAVGWASYPRAVGHSGRALDDLVAFFRRGLIDDGFDVVPAWNVH
ncbi:alpha/beta hydrolase [Subtercola sp. YIM 133946]|uniref:alpha/beta hydrolase n=1 Tax=Subtercola sp. YIM 133946 TaxID=3118909 RepID=UPI002F93D9E2